MDEEFLIGLAIPTRLIRAGLLPWSAADARFARTEIWRFERNPKSFFIPRSDHSGWRLSKPAPAACHPLQCGLRAKVSVPQPPP